MSSRTLDAIGLAAALAGLGYMLAAVLADTPRPGAVLPRPALPTWVRRRLTAPGTAAVVVAAAVAIAVLTALTLGAVYVPVVMVIGLGAPAAYTDARELRIPDELTYTLAATMAITVTALDIAGFDGSAVRALLCGLAYAALLLSVALFAPTARPRAGSDAGTVSAAPTALGLGDIKLAVGLGAALGWVSLNAPLTALLLTALGHLGWALCCALARRAGAGRAMTATALGPWMVGGAALSLMAVLPPL